MSIRVTIWNEGIHEQVDEQVRSIYPMGIHGAIQENIKNKGDFTVRSFTMADKDQGLSQEMLDSTDVLVWWSHLGHKDLEESHTERVYQRVLSGMGLIALHSSHGSKLFRRLLGTNCTLQWREAHEKEIVWNIAPFHPITRGIGEFFTIPHSEMYGERFDIPTPDELIFISWYQGGNVFRSGCTFQRGNGKIFYFGPGHESYPIYHEPVIGTIIANAIKWAYNEHVGSTLLSRNADPVVPIK